MEEFLWFLDHQTPQESGTCFEGNIERDFIARAKDFSKISRPIRIALRCPKRRNDGLSHQRVRDLQVSKQRRKGLIIRAEIFRARSRPSTRTNLATTCAFVMILIR